MKLIIIFLALLISFLSCKKENQPRKLNVSIKSTMVDSIQKQDIKIGVYFNSEGAYAVIIYNINEKAILNITNSNGDFVKFTLTPNQKYTLLDFSLEPKGMYYFEVLTETHVYRNYLLLD